jgi:protein arginine kinase
LGILQSARIMTNDEFMRLISNVRFGVAMGFVENISFDEINRLIIEAQPATLMLYSGKKFTPDERHAYRARTVNEVFKNKKDKADDCDVGTDTEQ